MQPALLEDLYVTDNIIIGVGEVVAVREGTDVYWILPGGGRTYDRAEATAFALRLNSMISSNLEKYKRRLFK